MTAEHSGRGRILIVEDDEVACTLLVSLLSREGYACTVAGEAKTAARWLAGSDFDLVLLDLNLPDGDGLVLAEAIRARSDLPIVVATSRLDRDTRLEALGLGADDFVTKPFMPQELLLRVRNVLVRSGAEMAAGERAGEVYRFGPWSLDVPRRLLADRGGKRVNLTRAEFDVLHCLAVAQGKPVSRQRLAEAAADGRNEPVNGSRSVDVLISRIRRKIEGDGPLRAVVETVPGTGYRLRSTDA